MAPTDSGEHRFGSGCNTTFIVLPWPLTLSVSVFGGMQEAQDFGSLNVGANAGLTGTIPEVARLSLSLQIAGLAVPPPCHQGVPDLALSILYEGAPETNGITSQKVL